MHKFLAWYIVELHTHTHTHTQTHLSIEQLTGRGTVPDGSLDGLDLHGDSREHRLLQPIELIEAAPGSTLHQPNEDTPHGLNINPLRVGGAGRRIDKK